MKTIKRMGVVAAGAAMLCATGLATAGTASAEGAGPYAQCDKSIWSYCLALYYNSDLKGSHTSFFGGYANLAAFKFMADGAGKGQGVKNNAASASFWELPGGEDKAMVYYNSNWKGPCDAISTNKKAMRLHNTYNEDASIQETSSSVWWAGCYEFN